MRRTAIVIHPFIFCLFPILSLYLNNADQMLFTETIRSMLVAIAVAGCLLLLLFLVSKDLNKSAVIVSLFFILFFSHFHISTAAVLFYYYITRDFDTFVSLVTNNWIPIGWLIAWGLLFLGVIYLIMKSKRDFHPVTRVVNVIALALAVALLVNRVYTYVRSDKANQYVASWQENAGLAQAGRNASAAASSLPDIYYIILDGYARADVLEEIYGVDNPTLSTYLVQRGFYVAEKSRANYIQTPLSLASSLNYMYLDDVATEVGSQSTNLMPLRAMIESSKIIQELRSRGYQILTFSSGFPITEIRNADKYLSPPGSLNGFETILVTATPIPILLELPFLKTQYEIHGERILYMLTHLPDATQVEAPTFVFAHILAPHAPFVFGADGEPLQPDNRFSVGGGFNPAEASRFIDIGDRDYAQGYRDQVSFLAKRLQVTIDEILTRSPKPPVIIIQADHGPGTVLRWEDFQASYLAERTSILNAYYFPDRQYDTLYPEITPVNTFRIILNKYFGTDYEVLADTSFFSTYEQPYAFIDATSQDLPSSLGR